jgi:hypothetical protein
MLGIKRDRGHAIVKFFRDYADIRFGSRV